MTEQELRKSIKQLVAEFYRTKKANRIFIPGKTPIRYAGRVYDEKEIQAAVEASLDFWLTEGRFALQFQTELAAKIGGETCFACQFRFLCESLGTNGSHIPFIGRPTIDAWR